jgi:hypothetical protein
MLQHIRKIKTELLVGVESLVQEKKIGYIDAAILYCETNNIDVEQAASIIQNNKEMTSKIEEEAVILNYLKA